MVAIYPKRQTIIIAVICIIAVISTVVYAQNNKYEQSNSNVAIVTTNTENSNNQQSLQISSSTNWRNEFFSSTNNNIAANQNSNASSSPLTLTDQMSRELFSRFTELKQNNLDSNQQLMQDTANQTLSDTIKNAKQPKTYSSSDISVINTSNLNDQTYHTYGNTVANILITYMPKDNAPTIANDALNNNNMSLLKNIDPLISNYKTILQKLLNVPVPQTLETAHINLLNSISSMLFISEDLENVQGDPMQSVVALSMFGNTQDSMKSSLLNIKNYFSDSNITFTSNESGALFSTITP